LKLKKTAHNSHYKANDSDRVAFETLYREQIKRRKLEVQPFNTALSLVVGRYGQFQLLMKKGFLISVVIESVLICLFFYGIKHAFDTEYETVIIDQNIGIQLFASQLIMLIFILGFMILFKSMLTIRMIH